MKLEVRKIENKIKLDTTMEGCATDCLVTYYVAYNEATTMGGVANCLKTKWTCKGNCLF